MKTKRSNAGFTLVEIIVTLTVLAIVAAFSVPSFSGFIADANAKDCKAKMTDLAKAYTNQLVENRVTTPGSTVDTDVMEKVLVDKGATKSDTADMTYTGLCPDGGTYTIKTQPATTDPNLTTMILSCDKHGDQEVVTGATAKVVTSIAVTKQPSQTAYTIGETFSAVGGQITITYNDRTTKTIDMTTAMCSDPDMSTTGTKPVTVTYGGKTANFDITIEDATTLKSIAVTPTDKKYYKGDTFNINDFVLTAYFSNGSQKTIAWSETGVTYSPTDIDMNTTGQKQVTASYMNKNVTKTYDFTFNVVEPTVTALAFSKEPTKEFFVGDTFSVGEGELLVTYNNGKTETIAMTDSAVSITGYDMNTASEQTLIVTYKEGTLNYPIKVKAVELESISIGTDPTLVFYQGDQFNVAGGKLTLTYNNGKVESNAVDMAAELDSGDLTCSGYDLSENGESTQTVTVTYEEKTTTYDITFHQLESIAISDEADKQPTNYFVKGTDSFNVNGGVLVLTYDDYRTKEVTMTLAMIPNPPNISTTQTGTKTVYVKYLGKPTSYSITIVDESALEPADIFRISIINPPAKTSYYVGDALNLDGSLLRVVYVKWVWFVPYTIVENIPITNDMCSGYNLNNAGDQEITVHVPGSRYNEYYVWIWKSHLFDSFTITVKQAEATNIAISQAPTDVFIQGSPFSTGSGKLTATLTNGDKETVDMTTDMCSGYDMNTVGNQTVKVRYKGAETSYNILVAQASKMPNQTGIDCVAILKDLVLGTKDHTNQAYTYYQDTKAKRKTKNVPLDCTGPNYGQKITKNSLIDPLHISIETFNANYSWMIIPNTKTGTFDGNATETDGDKYGYTILWMNEGIYNTAHLDYRYQVYAYNTNTGSWETGTVTLGEKTVKNDKGENVDVIYMNLSSYIKLSIN